jgi:transposase-like protein
VARPSKYKPEFDGQAVKLCKLGATDRELAEFFGVAESTLNLWKSDYPTFSESLKRGKGESDARVEQSLYRRALGYSHDAVKILMTKDGDVYREEYVEHYPPDTVACIFWLKNRQPEHWRDKFDVDTGLSRERATQLLGVVEQRLAALENSPESAAAATRQSGTAH